MILKHAGARLRTHHPCRTWHANFGHPNKRMSAPSMRVMWAGARRLAPSWGKFQSVAVALIHMPWRMRGYEPQAVLGRNVKRLLDAVKTCPVAQRAAALQPAGA